LRTCARKGVKIGSVLKICGFDFTNAFVSFAIWLEGGWRVLD